MKIRFPRWMTFSALLAATSALAGCSAMEGVVEAGAWIGMFSIVLILGFVAGGAVLIQN